MISDSLIRKKFVHETITAGINAIYDRQAAAIARHLHPQTGRLRDYATRRTIERQISDGSYTAIIPIPLHLRLQDIRLRRKPKKQRAALYNRLAWPIIYRDIIPELRYGFTEEVRQQLRSQLQTALDARLKE